MALRGLSRLARGRRAFLRGPAARTNLRAESSLAAALERWQAPLEGRQAMPSITARNILTLLIFLLVVALPPTTASAVDSRTERARQIRDEILSKRHGAAAPPVQREDPFSAAVSAARERVAELEAQIEETRRRSEGLAAPREKLAARSEELASVTARLQEENRARVEAIYRSAKLGAGAAGWNAEPARSARLSRYLAAVAAVQHRKLEVVEVEHGSAIAALDQARAEDAAAAAELRVLDADRAEAESRLGHALAEAGLGPAMEDASPASATTAEEDGATPGMPEDEGVVDRAGEEAAGRPEPEVFADAPEDEIETSAREVERGLLELAAKSASARPGAKEADTEHPPSGEDFNWPAGTDPVEDKRAALSDDAASARDAAAAAGAKGAAAGVAAADPVEGASVATAAAGDQVPAPGPGAGAGTAPPAKPKGLLSRIFGNDRDSDAFSAARGTLPAPVAGKVVANYGQQHKSGATYRGAILRAGHSAPVKAVAAGQVSFAGVVPGLGNTVIVSHGGRYHTVYARLGSVEVKEGQSVTGGTELGVLPEDNADMHFELRDQGKAIDPLPWLKSGMPGAAP